MIDNIRKREGSNGYDLVSEMIEKKQNENIVCNLR
jgi:hypothetical protein